MLYPKLDQIIGCETSRLCCLKHVSKGISLDQKPFFSETFLEDIYWGDNVPLEHQSCFVTSLLLIRD